MKKFILTSVLGGVMACSASAQVFPGNGSRPFVPATGGFKPIPTSGFNPVPTTGGYKPIPQVPVKMPVLPTPISQNFGKTVVTNLSNPHGRIHPQTTGKPLTTVNPLAGLTSALGGKMLPATTTGKIPVPLTGLGGNPLQGLAGKPLTGLVGKPLTGGKQFRFVLDDPTNQQLGNLSNSGKLDPLSQSSLANAMAGQSLSDQDRLLLKMQMLNPSLSGPEKAAVAKALQEDLKEKQQLLVTPQPLIIPQVLPQPLVVVPPQVSPPTIVIPQPPVTPQTDPQPPITPQTDPQPPMGGGGSDIDDTDTASKPALEFGLKITQVGATGAAATAGLKAGDVLLMVGKQRVQSFDEMTKILSQATGDVEVMYYSDGKVQTLTITPKSGKLGVAVEPIPLG